MSVSAAAFGVFGLGELTLAAGALIGASTPSEGIGGLIAAGAFIALALGCVAMARAEVRVAEDGIEARNRGQRVMDFVQLTVAEGD